MSVRLRVPAVDDPDFVAEVSYTDEAVLRLAGSAHAGATAALGALLHALDGELRDRRAAAVVVDLRGVELMAAACMNELIAWIGRLSERPPGDRYEIRLRANPSLPWQAATLAALACFDTAVVRIV